jgi:hypothetical protein
MAKHSFLLLLVCFGGCSRALVQVKREPRSHDTSRIAWAKLMARAGRSFRSSARGSRVAHQPEDRCGGAIDRAILRPPQGVTNDRSRRGALGNRTPSEFARPVAGHAQLPAMHDCQLGWYHVGGGVNPQESRFRSGLV